MKARFLRHHTLGPIIGGAFLAASCNRLHSPMPPDHASGALKAAPTQLAQLDFGHQAMFARCVPPACPLRTPKTIAPETPSPSVPLAAAEPVAPDPVTQSPAPTTETSRTITVQFAFGSAWLSPAAQSRLDGAISDIARVHSVTITGRTDSTGSLAVNEALALARAHAVSHYLLKAHPAIASTLRLQAQGACCFIASNDTQIGRKQNRRSEVVFQMNEGDAP